MFKSKKSNSKIHIEEIARPTTYSNFMMSSISASTKCFSYSLCASDMNKKNIIERTLPVNNVHLT